MLLSRLLPLSILVTICSSSSGPLENADSNLYQGAYPSLTFLQAGVPAISCYDAANGNLEFVSAIDSVASSWNPPVIVYAPGNVGTYTSLAVSGNVPVIAFRDETNNWLLFISAKDNVGSAWNTPPTVVDSVGNAGKFASIVVTAGSGSIGVTPRGLGIAYSSTVRSVSRLMFAVASSSAGMAWQPVVVDTVTVSSIATSVVPTGPAIAYIDSANSVVKYVIATSSDGSWWGNPITLSPVSGLPTFVGLTSAAGAPCVAFQTAGDVVFMKSSTANGGDVASWPAPASVDGNYTTGGVAGVGAMSSIRGQPFLTWYDSTEYSVMYTTTNDAGDSWSEPIPLRNGIAQFVTAANLGGYPGVAYFDTTSQSLEYILAEFPSSTPTPSSTPSPTPTPTPTPSPSSTNTRTATISTTPTPSLSESSTASISLSSTSSVSWSATPSTSLSSTRSMSWSATAAQSLSATSTISVSRSIAPSLSRTPAASESASPPPSITPSLGSSPTASPSVTPPPSLSSSISSSSQPSPSFSPSSSNGTSAADVVGPHASSPAPIIGGVVGGVGGLALLALLVFLVLRYRNGSGSGPRLRPQRSFRNSVTFSTAPGAASIVAAGKPPNAGAPQQQQQPEDAPRQRSAQEHYRVMPADAVPAGNSGGSASSGGRQPTAGSASSDGNPIGWQAAPSSGDDIAPVAGDEALDEVGGVSYSGEGPVAASGGAKRRSLVVAHLAGGSVPRAITGSDQSGAVNLVDVLVNGTNSGSFRLMKDGGSSTAGSPLGDRTQQSKPVRVQSWANKYAAHLSKRGFSVGGNTLAGTPEVENSPEKAEDQLAWAEPSGHVGDSSLSDVHVEIKFL